MIPYTLGPGAGYLGPVPSSLPPRAGAVPGYPRRPRGAAVVADTERFLAFSAPVPTAQLSWPRRIYVLDKVTAKWSTIRPPFYDLWPRLFGKWLATTVEDPNPTGRESPGLENERANEVDRNTPTGVVRELPRVRGLYSTDVFMPGKLLLENLISGRQITINTGQQDSEVLDVGDNGLVVYRVNNSIYSAQIVGDHLSPSTMVVKGDDVPEVHWVFWSSTSAGPSAGTQMARPAQN